MGQKRWFYRTTPEWIAIAERLKQMACPHCKKIGMLIQHGFLYGFDESNRRTLRARRIFCSNRQARHGCGRTFSVWLADKIRRLSLTTTTLWRLLQHAATRGILAALRALQCPRSDRTLLRLWKRFKREQSNIRVSLSGRCPPPQLPTEPSHRPVAHDVAHLRAAFPKDPCPITTFQHTLQTSFV